MAGGIDRNMNLAANNVINTLKNIAVNASNAKPGELIY